jgi:hypothetical protein
MLGEPAFQVIGDAGIERPVSALQNVNGPVQYTNLSSAENV